MPELMRAWATGETAGIIEQVERAIPVPGDDEVLVAVLVCGICRTDLHVIDHDIPVHHPAVIPGHQVIGRVVGTGPRVSTLQEGDLIGIAWLRRTCGVCEWCRSGAENLCPFSEYTGWDADGGYAEYATVPEAYAYRLPADTDPYETAPLLCAGIIGFRALRRANLPPGGVLGIYGFGSSAHITAQLAMASGARVFAMTRGERNRALAAELGVAFVAEATAQPPEPLDSAIIFAPAGELVPVALAATKAGGTVALAGIHMSDIPQMDYSSTLFHERDLRTVTANTREDGIRFLEIARNLQLSPTVSRVQFDGLGEALSALRDGHASGSLVLTVGL
ncbi:zinc-dependent alcohol dehydrogenase family protein [Leifsonia sp. A12D58]|uniref:zinc-dependent alcohol dehydrogenase family protein n=1 Tax=Leifsonia sp. A12D58 TaxID=3397674 RepID=UPI0039E043D8